jgi:hypothetical protein
MAQKTFIYAARKGVVEVAVVLKRLGGRQLVEVVGPRPVAVPLQCHWELGKRLLLELHKKKRRRKKKKEIQSMFIFKLT